MRIKDISVENYRNLNSATITFDESCNFIVGENNLGKSNILNLLNVILLVFILLYTNKIAVIAPCKRNRIETKSVF